MSLPRSIPLALVLATLACDDATGPDYVRQLGTIHHAGEEFVEVSQQDGRVDVTVHTYGNSCTEKDGDVGFVRGDTIVVRPYDRRQTGLCFLELVTLVHHVSVEVDAPGFHPVRIEGRRQNGLDTEFHVIETGVEIPIVPNPS